MLTRPVKGAVAPDPDVIFGKNDAARWQWHVGSQAGQAQGAGVGREQIVFPVYGGDVVRFIELSLLNNRARRCRVVLRRGG